MAIHVIIILGILKEIIRASIFPGSLLIWRLVTQQSLKSHLGQMIESDVRAIAAFVEYACHRGVMEESSDPAIKLFLAALSYSSLELMVTSFNTVVASAHSRKTSVYPSSQDTAQAIARNLSSARNLTYEQHLLTFESSNHPTLDSSNQPIPLDTTWDSFKLIVSVVYGAFFRVMFPRYTYNRWFKRFPVLQWLEPCTSPVADSSALMNCLTQIISDLREIYVLVPKEFFDQRTDDKPVMCLSDFLCSVARRLQEVQDAETSFMLMTLMGNNEDTNFIQNKLSTKLTDTQLTESVILIEKGDSENYYPLYKIEKLYDTSKEILRLTEDTGSTTWFNTVASIMIEHPLGSLEYMRTELLHRYCGFQFWAPVNGGTFLLDAVFLPAKSNHHRLSLIKTQFRKVSSAWSSDTRTLTSEGPEIGSIVIFCNPNADFFEAAAYHNDFVDVYLRHGINVVLFNHRGFGRSEGLPSPQIVASDAVDLAKFLITVGVERIGCHGRSIGGIGAAAIASALPDYVQWLCCDRTFGSLTTTVEKLLGRWVSRTLKAMSVTAENNANNFVASIAPMKVLCWDPNDSTVRDAASLRTAICRMVLTAVETSRLAPRCASSRQYHEATGGLPPWAIQSIMSLPDGSTSMAISSKATLLVGIPNDGILDKFSKELKILKAFESLLSQEDLNRWSYASEHLEIEVDHNILDLRQKTILAVYKVIFEEWNAADVSLDISLDSSVGDIKEKVKVFLVSLMMWGGRLSEGGRKSFIRDSLAWLVLAEEKTEKRNRFLAQYLLHFLRSSVIRGVDRIVTQLTNVVQEYQAADNAFDYMILNSFKELLEGFKEIKKLFILCTSSDSPVDVYEQYLGGWLVPIQCGHNGALNIAESAFFGFLLDCAQL